MPSSHTSDVTAAMVRKGHLFGFDTNLFGFASIIVKVVIYDATSTDHWAGFHFNQINRNGKEVYQGKVKPIWELKELGIVRGLFSAEALVGIGLGILVTMLTW